METWRWASVDKIKHSIKNPQKFQHDSNSRRPVVDEISLGNRERIVSTAVVFE